MKPIMENWRKYLKEESQNFDDLVQFIVRSNKIEGYDVSPEEIQNALDGLQQGYPLTYVAQNPHVYSHLAGLEAARLGSSTVNDILNIHKAMGSGALEAGSPGLLRSGRSESEHGTKYVSPEDISNALEWWVAQNWLDPFEGHTVYELIHPFEDGNGRSGRIILAAALGFDFNGTNSLIGDDYFSRLDSVGEKYQGKFWK